MSGFSNPIIGGGGSLVYPSIHSPGYSAGIRGWSINKDGSAEFNDLTIRGTFFGTDFIISAGGVFLYSGTPAHGNLAISLAPAATTTDPEGNTVQGGGLAVYGSAGQAVFLGLITAGLSELQLKTGASFEKTPANLASEIAGSGTGAVMETLFSGPQGNHSGQQDWAQVLLASGSNGSGAGATGNLIYVDNSGTAHIMAQWSSTGFGATLINGLTLGTFSAIGSATGPGANAGNPPTSGAGTGAGFCTAGDPLNTYLTAFASTYNLTAAAVANHESRLNAIAAVLNGFL